MVVFQQDQFYSKVTDYLILVFFVVLLGCTLLQANSIIIDLTVKDKMSKRMEFFLASGIDLFLIHIYVEVQQELGIGRTSFYKMKKQALGYLGFYFYTIVVPQAKDKRFKPSLGVEEE